MCYYDLRTFENCLCKRWGDFRSACVQSSITDGICDRKFPSGREGYNPGTCERCQEVDAITKELARGERKLAQSLIAGGGHSALEELSSAVMGVYEEILNQRRREKGGVLKGIDIIGGAGSGGVNINTDGSGLMGAKGEGLSMDWLSHSTVNANATSRRHTKRRRVALPPRSPERPTPHVERQRSFQKFQGWPLGGSERLDIGTQSGSAEVGIDTNGHDLYDFMDGIFNQDPSAMFDGDSILPSFGIHPYDLEAFSNFQSTKIPTAQVPQKDGRNKPFEPDLQNLKIFKTYARGFRNGLRMHDDLHAPSTKTPYPGRDPPEIQLSRRRFRDVAQKFLAAANAPYKKLKQAAYSDGVSANFRRFCNNLGDLDDILETGFDALEKLLDGEIPSSLEETYSFLQVAYAMSQGFGDTPDLDQPTFISGISIFLACVPGKCATEPEDGTGDLFDEIVSVMWDELEDGVGWAKQQDEGTVFEAEDMNFNGESSRVTQRMERLKKPASSPTWKDLVTGTIFVHVVHFLKSLDDIGTIFFYLCGTFCSTINSLATGFLSPSAHDSRKPGPDIPNPREMELRDYITEYILAPLKRDRSSKMDDIARAAKYMLRAGPLTNLPDFEQYIIGLTKIHHRPQREFLRSVKRILFLCQRCYYSLPSRCRRLNDMEYSDEYIESRIQDEEWWYLSEETSNSQAEDTAFPTIPSFHVVDDVCLSSSFASEASTTSSTLSSIKKFTSPTPKRTAQSALDLPRTDFSYSRSDSINTIRASPTSQLRYSKNKKRRVAPEHKPYSCEFPDCDHRETTEANLKRHQISEHGDESIRNRVYRCDVPGCNAQRTGARAKENIKTHKKVVHGIRSRRGKGP
ncbi:hypothetical protein H072_4224 [Dactylellina haptotyla CBS 200.50]|uniref:C2H2-type domain-containing protein n=1 Tax=Dactylellina haptotyla (strain CBS 200.50) TaxID=1284197 RepID=S8AL63_DACHA|nr:hypothetical protein H072_4224 [Dactylellina haptotyla CBS 200.50]